MRDLGTFYVIRSEQNDLFLIGSLMRFSIAVNNYFAFNFNNIMLRTCSFERRSLN